LIYFSNHREEDPLRNEPWGINKFSLATSASSIDNDTTPRFVPVVFGFHPDVPDSDLEKFLDDWDSCVCKEIQEICDGEEPALLEMVRRAVDKVVKGMSRETFLRIHTTEMLNKFSGSNSAATDVRRMLASFLENVKFSIDSTVQKSLMERTIRWQMEVKQEDE
jgi:hypothetical protein